MTVHARRYGRWCREHFDTEPVPDPEQPAEAAAPDVTAARAAQAQAGDAPEAKPGSLN
ncbi:hypothetical protein P3102_09470 [Amycolatopsis sp. QT-25]|uniref:hypothetical protein n=1 Tax=Amycolatopsis sp. QT-25 TaxID=3034022 RepID=UPI0023ECC8EA|nr:hypothetical protein [Amycolatopsis sp. QT-25]WET81417.1 hypothetical protein P3102_09470 [Amycolatopsis sp. QT-25]